MGIRVKIQPWGASAADKGREVAGFVSRTRRKLASAGLFALALWLAVHVVFGANGMVVYQNKRTEYRNLQAEINNLQQENQRYTEQVKSLKSDPDAIEREAREQLRYTRPGEVVYVMPEARVEHPAANTAKK
jgi:cell division protein FtsB